MTTESQDVQWSAVLSDLVAGADIGRERARYVVAQVLAGEATETQIGAYLVAMAAKGESTDEILGMREAMFDASTPLELPAEAVDIVGVGGAPRRRVSAFNISTISAIVASAAGAIICKHGNRRASSTSGSFDLLEALGADIEIPADRVEAGVHELGLGFAFARAHHPSMRHVGPSRAQLGIPTVFNVLGPLAHPGRVTRQVLGVPDAARAEQVAAVLADAGIDLVWVVHGHGDLDELALSGPSNVTEIRGSEVRRFVVDPAEIGLTVVETEAILGGDAEENARLTRTVLAGEPSPNRDIVLLNAGAGLVVGGVAQDLADGVAQAAAAIDDGRAAAKLESFVAFTQG
ncbi:MAG: anthranilate phosphoribosyltransferase [Actinomycetota bacterium]